MINKLIIERSECIDDCSKNNIYKYEYNNSCFKSCSEVSEYLGLKGNYEIYYNYNKTKCIDEIPDGYYLNDTNEKTIDKCNIKCKTCNKDSNINNLCLSCSIQNNYYPILHSFMHALYLIINLYSFLKHSLLLH